MRRKAEHYDRILRGEEELPGAFYVVGRSVGRST